VASDGVRERIDRRVRGPRQLTADPSMNNGRDAELSGRMGHEGPDGGDSSRTGEQGPLDRDRESLRESGVGWSSRGGPVWRRSVTVVGVLLGVVLLGAVVVKRARVSDDAYITFRSAENFVHGRGPAWNPGERVQGYTHPLWLVLVSGLRAFTGEVFYTSQYLGFGLTLAAVLVMILGVAASSQIALLGLAIVALSRAFTDYSMSGLENPLTDLLLITLLLLDRGRSAGFRRRFGFTLVASLC
jgi:hypothetical protein